MTPNGSKMHSKWTRNAPPEKTYFQIVAPGVPPPRAPKGSPGVYDRFWGGPFFAPFWTPLLKNTFLQEYIFRLFSGSFFGVRRGDFRAPFWTLIYVKNGASASQKHMVFLRKNNTFAIWAPNGKATKKASISGLVLGPFRKRPWPKWGSRGSPFFSVFNIIW